MKKACIFDLDGTLLNTLPTIAQHMNRALREHGFAPYPAESYKHFVGNGARRLVSRALNAQGALSPDAVNAVYDRYAPLYDSAPYEGTAPYDGIPAMLDALAAQGILLAVLSNKPDSATRAVVAHFFPSVPFTVVRGGRDGFPLKPAPDGVYAILDTLGVAPDECLYVGDSGVDMQTGTAAGLFTVGVEWGFRGKEELLENGACATISSPRALLSYL